MDMYQVTHLGRSVQDSDIDASILNSIPRVEARRSLPMTGIPFSGADFWTAYALAWLDQNGMPKLAIADITVACESENIIESKSMKLYLNSFYKKQMESVAAVAEKIRSELCEVLRGSVAVELFTLDSFR